MGMDVTQRPDPAPADAPGSAFAVAQALQALPDADLLRLRALARLRARALPPGLHWSDLLQEALVRALDGSRQWKRDVPLLVFLAGIMRSLCHEYWRQRRRETALIAPGLPPDEEPGAVACPAPDPERVLAASEAVAAIRLLFAGDGTALRIVAGLAQGMAAAEIQALHAMSELEYDSARRRMRRAMLRAGLAGRDA